MSVPPANKGGSASRGSASGEEGSASSGGLHPGGSASKGVCIQGRLHPGGWEEDPPKQYRIPSTGGRYCILLECILVTAEALASDCIV